MNMNFNQRQAQLTGLRGLHRWLKVIVDRQILVRFLLR